jgi:hypothetical protein
MKAHVLVGSKSEIAETVARMDGVVREAIVFVEGATELSSAPSEGDIFGEMEPFTVRVAGADDSRGVALHAYGGRMILLDTNLLARMTI